MSYLEAIAEHFPYRNPDGTPAFWHYQKEVCEKTLQAFDRGKRVVVIDAPVGSGKSVINYTILKSQGAKSVYITAQKTLQDQIDNEDWPSVKSVKGRNAYICNLGRHHGIECHCDRPKAPDKIQTCMDTFKFAYNTSSPTAFSKLVDNILATINETGQNKAERRARTSFASAKELMDTISFINESSQPGCGQKEFIKKVACNIFTVECPVKSARTVAKLADIAVLNPDAYYALNKTAEMFVDREHMVVDEAHRLDDAVQRMFRLNIPLGLFKDCFGIVLDDLPFNRVEDFCVGMQEKFNKSIWPIICAFRLMDRYKDIFSIHNTETYTRENIQDKDLSKAVADITDSFGSSGNFCLISCLVAAVRNDNLAPLAFIDKRYGGAEALYKMMRDDYVVMCETARCDNTFDLDKTFMPMMTKYIKKIDKFVSYFGNDDSRHEHAQHVSYSKIQQKTASHLISIVESIESDLFVLHGLVKSKYGGNRVFVCELNSTTKEKACVGTQYQKYYETFEYDPNAPEAVLDIIPLHIGCLLQNFIFKGIKTIVLSSGTWPDPVGMLRGYGFSNREMEVLRIDPIFEPKNRPIFVNNNPVSTDFSQKSNNGVPGQMFRYQTPEGARKFCGELYKLISYIRQKHGRSCGIAVHCFNYGLSKLIAEYYPDLNESFLIHLPNVKSVENFVTGYTTFRRGKDSLISQFCGNPGTGLTLVSPSIIEGLDFKEDICRAQIILKAPIPNLGDRFNYYKFNGCEQINMPADKMFLDRKLAIDLNQAYGRNVRGTTDWGETYIVDLAISKRLARAFGVHLPGIDNDAPGNLGRMNMSYIKQGIQCSKDSYGRFEFRWPAA